MYHKLKKTLLHMFLTIFPLFACCSYEVYLNKHLVVLLKSNYYSYYYYPVLSLLSRVNSSFWRLLWRSLANQSNPKEKHTLPMDGQRAGRQQAAPRGGDWSMRDAEGRIPVRPLSRYVRLISSALLISPTLGEEVFIVSTIVPFPE